MAYSQTDLDNIDKAIAAGELEVSDGDTRVRYRSMSELKEARQHIANELGKSNSRRPNRMMRMTVGKGL